MLSRFFGYDRQRHQCTSCGHVDEAQVEPQVDNTNNDHVMTYNRDPLWGWFDSHIARMEEDLMRQTTSIMDHPVFPMMGSIFDPTRRQRMFDVLFEPNATVGPRFVENAQKNTLDCELSTGCGDFFRPEDVEVNISGRNVEFKAKREEKSDDGSSYSVREVRRMFTVPETADADNIQASLSPTGKLMLQAPLLKPIALAPEQKPKKSNEPVPLKVNRITSKI